MKELHLISGGDAGGAKTHVLTLVRKEQEHGTGELAALGKGALYESACAQKVSCQLVSGGFFRSVRTVRRLSAEGEYSVLHCHGSRANLIGALLKGHIPCRVISTIHSDHRLDYLGRPFARLVYGTPNSLALRRMDALFCVSDQMREVYALRGFSRARLFSLYNGVDFSRPLQSSDRAAFFGAHGFTLPGDAVIVGAVMRPSPVKDLPTLVRGFSMAKKENARLVLALAGISPAELARAVAAECDGVFPLGWIEDMDSFYASVDFLALTSLSETFPYALTDGARYSLPAAASAVGGVPSLVRDGETGLLFPAGDAEALKAALLRLADDEALRKSLGGAVRERAERLFSLDATAAREETLVERISRPHCRVLLSGAYGLGNTGDELMAEAILSSLHKKMPTAEITLLTRSPRASAIRFDVDTLSPLRFVRFLCLLGKTDLLLSGGGNLLQDCTSRRSLCYYLFTLRAAHRRGVRVLLWGVGLGPLSEGGWRKTIRTLNACADTIVFRDKQSCRAALDRALAVRDVSVAADPTLNLPENGEQASFVDLLREGERHMAICLRRSAEEEQMLRIAELSVEYARKNGLRALILPMNPRKDGELSEKAARLSGAELVPSPVSANPRQARALLGKMDIVISTRLHALILAAAADVPFVGLATDERIGAFCESVSMPWCPAAGLQSAEKISELAERAAAQKFGLAERVEILRKALRKAEKSVFGDNSPEV